MEFLLDTYEVKFHPLYTPPRPPGYTFGTRIGFTQVIGDTLGCR